mmetsp:Transcript_22789/g.32144  ORF Transcript_22789/g.32144 Transcript_22789/m.32144 type:complete len:243 (-) Transcript_22789:629-1357(-)
MKSDEAVNFEIEREEHTITQGQRFMIAGEAPILLGKACELLVKDLSLRAWRHTERNKRRTLQKHDIHAAVGETEVYDFLIDIVPRIQLQTGKSISSEKYQATDTTNESSEKIDLKNTANQIEQNVSKPSDTELSMAHLQQMQYNIMMQQQQQQQQQQFLLQNQKPTESTSVQGVQQHQQMMMAPSVFFPTTVQWQTQQFPQSQPGQFQIIQHPTTTPMTSSIVQSQLPVNSNITGELSMKQD